MNCREYEQDLALAATGRIAADRLPLVLSHIQVCPECALQYQQLALISTAHRSAAAEVQMLSLRAPRTLAHSGQGTGDGRSSWEFRGWRWWFAGGIAAVVALVLLVRGPLRPRVDEATPGQVAVTRVAPPLNRSGTLGGYRNASNKSGDEALDTLLTRDAELLLRPVSRADLLSLRDEVLEARN